MANHDSRGRIERNINNRYRSGLPDAKLLSSFASAAAGWILEKPGRMNVGPSGRVQITTGSFKTLNYAAKTLRWMNEGKHHHGQQAEEIARTVLQAVCSGHLGFDKLHEDCKRFQSTRMRHIDRNGETKQRAKPDRLELKTRPGGTAVRLTTEKDLKRAGHELSNCLANPRFLAGYVAKLRKEESAFYVIKDDAGESAVGLQFGLFCRTALQARGPNNERPFNYRRRILELMARRKFGVGDCRDLWSIGICDELLAAGQEVKRFQIELEEVPWHFEVAPGALVARCHGDGQKTYILRSAGWGDPELPVYWSTQMDEHNDWDGYTEGALARGRVRQLRRNSKGLAAACKAAFADAAPEFREDWFGVRS